MEKWEIKQIVKTLDKCFGLRAALKSFKDVRIPVEALAQQSGFRIKFISDHLEEIKEL